MWSGWDPLFFCYFSPFFFILYISAPNYSLLLFFRLFSLFFIFLSYCGSHGVDSLSFVGNHFFSFSLVQVTHKFIYSTNHKLATCIWLYTDFDKTMKSNVHKNARFPQSMKMVAMKINEYTVSEVLSHYALFC